MSIINIKKILPATQLINTKPANLVQEDLLLFKNDFERQLPEVYLYEAKNINVTPHGVIFKNFKVLNQFLIWPSHKKEFNFYYLVRNYFKRKKIIANSNYKYIICFDYWSMGYFHWMCDFLPKLLLIENYCNDFVLILPKNHQNSFIEDSLKMFHIKKKLYFSDNEYLSLTNVIILSKICNSGDNQAELMLKLKNKFLNFYSPVINKLKHSKNIYVSRSKTKGRFILNEKEVIQTLETFGFTTIYFEDYSLKEQIEIAYNCSNLIGLHGANLTNLMFMNPTNNLLELRKENDIENNYYFSLASSFKLNYFYLQCKTTETLNVQSFNLTVNIEKLKNIVQTMLNI